MENETEPELGGTDCTSDAQCPDGYVCKNGRCVKKVSTIPVDPPPVGLDSEKHEEEN